MELNQYGDHDNEQHQDGAPIGLSSQAPQSDRQENARYRRHIRIHLAGPSARRCAPGKGQNQAYWFFP
ncbi:hypothetical protein D3C71_1717410 [compost metagenome]